MSVTPKTAGRVGIVGAIGAVLVLSAAFVKPWEGRERAPYVDLAGILTVCDGHTGKDIERRTYSDAECDAFLQRDLGAANAHVRRCIKYPLPVKTEAAFTSAAYNAGQGIVCSSTLTRLANAGELKAACDQLLRWDHVNGKRVRGLTRRRTAERDLCVQGLQGG